MTAFAFVFPGQVAVVGMLGRAGRPPAVRATLEEASAALGEDVARLIGEGPKEALDLTTNTQPVMLTAGIANYRAWLAEGGAAGDRRRPLAGRVHRAGRGRQPDADGCAAAGAPAPRRCRTRCRSAPAAWPRSWVWTPPRCARLREGAAESGRSGRGRQLQRSEADRHRRLQGRRRSGLREGSEGWAPSALPLPVSAPFHSSLMKPAAERPA